ncbi:MFS general substrate transporter [Cristinia sonorae]|uniref:MFS general substrate transporter n=1 Tax=Cristinia sonorae TaxID=1940300 RepID=A0A8K0UR26_9AGAR|nr:MFS general substrate transporter [Cristinia sonorae]
MPQRSPRGITTSLESISVHPRTPKTPRTGDQRYAPDDVIDEVELNPLTEDAREDDRLREDAWDREPPRPKKISPKDKRSMVLLVILYLIQGFPLGLALGSLPFLLREHLSYSQLAIFSLSSYPYSLKLLWSPIVDSFFFRSFGRRKSWILPMQLIIGTLMLAISFNAEEYINNPADHIYTISAVFTLLVTFSATQDIAVDGWALTLLSEENLAYAATCQTIGLNTGYFASFTVFLALNSQSFADKWHIPRLSLGAYLQFCSVFSYAVTVWLLFIKEDKEAVEEDLNIKTVYKTMWTIVKLRHVQTLCLLHLFAKIGWAATDAASQLKMVEKGLGREDLAVAVLIDFPFQILGGYVAGRWSRGENPLRPWMYAFWPRLLLALVSTLFVFWFPKPPIHLGFFILLIVQTVLSSFAGTIQFGGISAFHTRIADPIVGGTYMTLLATFTNMGGTWPRYFVLKGVDFFSVATCNISNDLTVAAAECVSDHGKQACKEIGGDCVTERDGFYIVSAVCIGLGVISVIFHMIPTARKLQALPMSKWKVYQ